LDNPAILSDRRQLLAGNQLKLEASSTAINPLSNQHNKTPLVLVLDFNLQVAFSGKAPLSRRVVFLGSIHSKTSAALAEAAKEYSVSQLNHKLRQAAFLAHHSSLRSLISAPFSSLDS
jgi:hypothetical protein